MNIEQIRWMLKRLERSSVDDFEIELDGAVLRGRFAARPAATAWLPAASKALPPSPAACVAIRASSMGLFCTTHPLTREPCATTGATVAEGEPLAYLTLGTVIRPVTASHTAVLRRCLVREGEVVGYGQALFELGL